jgi:hypothetical protein
VETLSIPAAKKAEIKTKIALLQVLYDEKVYIMLYTFSPVPRLSVTYCFAFVTILLMRKILEFNIIILVGSSEKSAKACC